MARRADALADDRTYLKLRREKLSYREIAKRCGISYRTVYLGVERAREAEAAEAETRRRDEEEKRLPNITPTFGASCKPMALLTCGDVHPNGPMPSGSRQCCPVCHQAPDVDWRDAFRNVRPLPRDPKILSPTEKAEKRTRRDRRKLLRRFASVA